MIKSQLFAKFPVDYYSDGNGAFVFNRYDGIEDSYRQLHIKDESTYSYRLIAAIGNNVKS